MNEHRIAFGRFLAGLIGCSKFPLDDSILSIFQLHCLYEAQHFSSEQLHLSFPEPIHACLFGKPTGYVAMSLDTL